MKRLLSKMGDVLSKDPFYFWAIFICTSFNSILSLFFEAEWVNAFFVIGTMYVISLVTTIVFNSVPYVGVVLKAISLVLVSFYDVIALFCKVKFGRNLDANIIETLLATTPNEIREFVHIFIPWWMMVPLVVLISLVIFLLVYQNRTHRFEMGKRQVTIHGFVFVYVAVVLGICSNRVVECFGEIGRWSIPFENLTINLKDYERDDIKLEETQDRHPDKIVLIIGESHSKLHSSLYGYPLETNPELKKLADDSLLHVFTEVSAPATATIECFKYILSTRRAVDRDKDWFRFPSLITIMKSAGYKTFWYSNQDEVGLYDNVASCFSHLCDEYRFNDSKQRLDGDLIDMHTPKDGQKEFIVYHFMGQHVDFANRYPASFRRFTEKDYSHRKSQHKDVIAHYDNACLYNDHVISSIMKKYNDSNALVIYFPDHGLDVYDKSDGYFGHSMRRGLHRREVGYKIPMFVFTPEAYRQNNPDDIETIKEYSHKDFCTADITFFVMELAKYKFCNEGCVK